MRRCRRKGRCVGERKEEDGRDMLSKVIGSAGSWWTGVGSLHPSFVLVADPRKTMAWCVTAGDKTVTCRRTNL